MLITVLYTCAECGLTDRPVIVPERDPAEDVVAYVKEKVAACVTEDHRRVSPRCRAQSLTNLKIPVDPNNPDAPIGAKA